MVKSLPLIGGLARRAKRLGSRARQHIRGARKSPYERWIAKRVKIRATLYQVDHESPGAALLSFVTPVWNAPPEYLRVLVESVLRQARSIPFEWILLDNGSTRPETTSFLGNLRKYSFIRLHRVEENLGIIGGTRFCLERAKNRYILPVDHDDYLYPDCTRIVTSVIQRHHCPALLYSDEDKLIGTRFSAPYCKPDWDPVLFTNSCYIAHLCVIDREKALDLGAYSDPRSDGSPDWDTFVRFVGAGIEPIHIPEILYSWRVHNASTAGNIDAKSFIHSSQRNVLKRFLRYRGKPDRYQIDYSPLFRRSPDWWIRRRHEDPRPLRIVLFGNAAASRVEELKRQLTSATDYPIERISWVHEDGLIPWLSEAGNRPESSHRAAETLVALIHDEVRVEGGEWPWEALAQFELYPDTGVVGGLLMRSSDSVVVSAGQYFGFGRGCETPDRGAEPDSIGYFGQLRKQHSVSAVTSRFCVVDEAFLRTANLGLHSKTLGAWLGASAKRARRRVVYSPFLHGWTDEDWEDVVSDKELRDFVMANRDLLPEVCMLSPHLGLIASHRYQPVAWNERQRHIQELVK